MTTKSQFDVFTALRDNPSPELLATIRLTQRYYHLLDSGMLSGRYGNKEGARRRQQLHDNRVMLGITQEQLNLLVNIHKEKT